MIRRATNTATEVAVATTQYLIFALGDEDYAIEIEHVREIRGSTPLTAVPSTPPYLRGVMNLRGTVAPVFGLREKFDLPSRPYDRFSIVLVVNVAGKAVGFIVDRVVDVITIEAGTIGAMPELGVRANPAFVAGMVPSGEKFAIVLDVARVVGDPPEIEACAPPPAPELTPV
jgi:purine-binding chemotaxis protein CheW